ncbi:MAG TPA: GH3 auxin-responsive promoter family protein [Thermodesulfobacteriota bacterium]
MLFTESAQRRALARLLRGIAPTPWGRSLRLDPRMPLSDLVDVPPTGPGDVEPFVARIVDGERDAMWTEGAVGLVRTTGTTGGARLLPLTAAHRRDLLAFARRLVLSQVRRGAAPLPRLSRWLLVTASTEIARVGGLPAGYAAALVQDAVRMVRPASAVPDPDIAAVDSREARLDRLVAVSRGARVGVLFGAPADLVALLGRLSELVGRPVADVWPTLEEIAWIGAHLGPHRAALERLVGRPVAFREVYGGAEGGFGADLKGDGRLRLVAGRIVFVFEPVGGGRRRLLHELAEAAPGSRFEVLVTTSAGLVQYRLGDVIEVRPGQPPAVAIVGRTGEVLSAAGEGLVPAEAQGALGELAATLGLDVVDWLASPAPVPDAEGRPRLRFVVEGRSPLPEADLAERLDAALARRSGGYAHARGAGRLGAVEVRLLPAGALEPYRSAVWPSGGPVKARPFAASWGALLERPGAGAVLAQLDEATPGRW